MTAVGSPTCPRCSEPVHPSERFCESCGTNLRLLRGATVATPSAGPCPGCGEPAPTGAESEYCPGCGLRRRDGTDHVEIDLGALAGVSDRGRVHARNEDAMALAQFEFPTGAAVVSALAAVVCDGVSSSPRPEQASRAAADAALGVLIEPSPTGAGPDGRETLLLAAVDAAADAVASLAGPQDHDAPACTLVAALLEQTDEHTEPDRPPRITVGWVGDSRAYWLAGRAAAEPARQLTTDHSWIAELTAAGLPPDPAAASGPSAHAITRWLGADTTATPEVVTLTPAGPGVLLLCSDGLWNHLPAADRLAAVARPLLDAGAGPLAVAAELTALANAGGGRDNITVVVIPVPPAPDHDRTTPRTSP